MSTQKISCLAVELKIFYASDADDNPTRRLLSLPPKHLSLRPRRRSRRRALHKPYGSKASFGCLPAAARCAPGTARGACSAASIVGFGPAFFNHFPYTSLFAEEVEKAAPTHDAAAARQLRDATAARALKQPLDAKQVRERQTPQAAAPAPDPLPQRSTPERQRRSVERLDAQRPGPAGFLNRRRIFVARGTPFFTRLFEQSRREAFERRRVFAQEFGCACERFNGARVERFEQRQEALAHAHTREALVLVHLVGAELDAAPAAVPFRVRAPRPTEKRSAQDDLPALFKRALGAHPAQPLGTAPAQQTEQDRLRLIVERVRRKHRSRAAFARDRGQELVACAARGLLKVVAARPRALADRGAADDYLEALRARQRLDPPRVLAAPTPAQPVIQVRRSHFQTEPSGLQEFAERQQARGRVCAARYGDEHAPAVERPAAALPFGQQASREGPQPHASPPLLLCPRLGHRPL